MRGLLAKRKVYGLSALASVVLLSGLVSGCGSTSAPQTSKHPGTTATGSASTLNVAISNDVSGFDPQKTASASTFEVAYNIYDTLVQANSKGELGPDLATSWKVSKDGLTWTFNLRPGVLFQNNKTMTADDVKYTFDRILNKTTADPNASDFADIQSVTVNSPTQVTFTLKKPYAPFLSSLALPWAAIIEQGTGDSLKTKPIGTGPYELQQWIPQQQIVLKKFNQAWDAKQANFNTVTFKVIPDLNTQLMDLQSSAVDIASVPPASASLVKSNNTLKLDVAPQNMVQIMAMNNKVKPLNNVLVRQAIEYAVNKSDIIQAVDFGYGQEIGSHMPVISPDYIDLNNMYQPNIEKAKQLLSQAGYPNGFSLTMALPQPYSMHIKTGEMIAQQLQKIGIQVKTQVIPWSQWISNVYLGRHYDLTVISHTGRLDPAELLDRYETNNKGNYFNFSDPKVDQDLKQAQSTTNPDVRKQLYQEVQTLLAKDAAAVYIQDPDTLLGLNNQVMGWQNYPLDVYNLRGVSKSN